MYHKMNNLGDMTFEQIETAFEQLPEGTTTLDLTDNFLDNKSNAELKDIFELFPDSVTTLILNENRLTNDSLCGVFNKVMPNLNTLDLTRNNIFYASSDSLEKEECFLNFITSPLANLNLSSNYSGSMMNGEKIDVIFQTIPNSVTHLNLSNTSLWRNHTNTLIKAFSSLQEKQITHLDLSSNPFQDPNESSQEIANVFSSLPRSVKALSLCSVGLKAITTEALIKIFGSIHTCSLNLGRNRLDTLTQEEKNWRIDNLAGEEDNQEMVLRSENDIKKIFGALGYVAEVATDRCSKELRQGIGQKLENLLNCISDESEFDECGLALEQLYFTENKDAVELIWARMKNKNQQLPSNPQNSSFYLDMLSGVLATGGAGLLVACAILAQPVLLPIGCGLLGAGIGGLYLNGFFSSKETPLREEASSAARP